MHRKNKEIHFPNVPLINTGIDKMPTPIITDPNGSYTGRPKDPNEPPIQYADDL